MKAILLSAFCCCLLLAVTRSVSSAKLDLSRVLKRSLLVLRTKRDLVRLSALKETEPGHFVRVEDVKDSLLPHPSMGVSVRTKRSINRSKRSGCSLGTCAVHDLAHRLYQLNSRLKSGKAPIDKLKPDGYGRRRRSVPERQVSLEMRDGQLQPVWKLDKLEALLRRT